jgi:hypothetical protein
MCGLGCHPGILQDDRVSRQSRQVLEPADVGGGQAPDRHGEVGPWRAKPALGRAELLGRVHGPPRRQHLPNTGGKDVLDLVVEPQGIEHAARLHVVASLAVADDPAASAGCGLERFRHLLALQSPFLSHGRNEVVPAGLLGQTRGWITSWES